MAGGDAYEVLAVRYATMRARRSQLFYRYHDYRERDALQRLDYFFWVLLGAQSVLLVDTGFDPLVGERRGRTCLCPPVEALERLGVDPAAIEGIVVTHCHYDHIGNLSAFPDARLFVPARELALWRSPVSRRFQYEHHTDRAALDWIDEADRRGLVDVIDDEAEVAPGVVTTTVGGHSPGQQVVRVRTRDGSVVLSSDAVHLYEELESDRPFGLFSDLSATYEAFDRVGSMCRDEGDVLVPGHDPAVGRRFPGLTHGRSDLAVQVG